MGECVGERVSECVCAGGRDGSTNKHECTY